MQVSSHGAFLDDRTVSGAKKTLIILTIINLFNYLDRYVLSAVLIPIQQEMGLSEGQLGQIGTAFMLGYFITSPFFGYLGDRFSRKKLIAIGVVGWSLGTFLSGFAQTFYGLILFRVLVGFGEASFGAIGPGVISDSFSEKRRNNAMTIFFLAIPLGAAIGYFIGGQLGQELGWRHAFYWTGAPGILLALLLLYVKEPTRGGTDSNSTTTIKDKPTLKGILGLLKIPEYILVVLGYTSYTFAMGAFAHWAPTFLTKTHGLTLKESTGFFAPALFVGGVVGTLVGGYIATWLQKKTRAGYAILLSTSVLVPIPLLTIAFLTENASTSMALSAISMVFLFLSTGPVNTLLVDICPAYLRSSGIALSIFCIHAFGDVWSPAIVGGIADMYNGQLRNGMLILPGAFVFAAIFWGILAVRQSKRPAILKT